MLKLHSNLSGMKIVSFQEEKALALFEDLVVCPDSAQVLGMFVRQRKMLKNLRKLIILPDILEISNAIYVQDAEAILDTDEIIRLKKIEKDYFSLIDLPVETRDGEKIGKITDYAFDALTGQIARFHTSPSLLHIKQPERVIGTEQVYKLSKEKLIIQNSQEKAPSKVKTLLNLEPELDTEISFKTDVSSS